MLGNKVVALGMLIDQKLITGIEPLKTERTNAGGNLLWNYYKCKDDKWILLGLMLSDRYWPDLCRALGLEKLQNDPKFVDVNARRVNAVELVSILDSVFITRTRDEWMEILRKHGDLLFEPVNTISEVAEDPQLRANDYITEFEHPSWGKLSTVGSPRYFSKAKSSIRLPHRS